MAGDDHVNSSAVDPSAQLELPLLADETGVEERRRLRPLRREWTPELLGRHFLLSANDIEQTKKCRGAENRLGFALTLLLVRFLNSVPGTLAEVPAVVVDFVSSQVQADPEVLTGYGKKRPQTRDDHAKRIRRYLAGTYDSGRIVR